MAATADDLIGKYVQLRDKEAEIKERHKEELKPYKDAMAKLEKALQDMLQEQGVNSMKGAHGTVYRQEVSNLKVTDFNETLQYIKDNERWDLLEKRVNKTVVQEIQQEGEDVPGTEIERTLKVQVRRS
jgi:hypothetical protein